MSYAANLIWLVAMSFAVLVTVPVSAQSQELKAEIKLGTIFSSDAGTTERKVVARIFEAYVKKTNDEGGIDGRMIRIFSYDDAEDSRRTLDLVRKLVEVDHVALLFNIGSRASNVIAPYIRFKKIPQFFNSEQMPPQRQAEILGNYISRNLPKATIAILSQADYIGAQFLAGFYAGLGMEHARSAIMNMDHIRPADKSGNRVARVSGSNSDILVIYGKADSELELLREMTELKWRPLVIMDDAALTLKLDQVDTSAGIISLANPWTAAEFAEWKAFRATYLSGIETNFGAAIDGYLRARAMVLLLRDVGGEITSERLIDSYNRMRREVPTLLDKRTIDVVRFNGKTWDVIESDVQHFQDNTRN